MLFILAGCVTFAVAEDKPMRAVLAQYDRWQVNSDSVNTTSVGIYSESKNSQITALYGYTDINAPLPDNLPARYHNLDIVAQINANRHQYLGIFKANSNKPISGGLHTYKAGVVYGYQWIQQPNLSLTIGGGLALGDFGIKTGNGKNWPLIPVPLVRLSYHNQWLISDLEFLTSPNLTATFFPESRISLNQSLRFDELKNRRDLIFDTRLSYQPFPAEHSFNEIAKLSVGVKNEHIGSFSVGDGKQEETVQAQYYALYSELDLTLLKLTVGRTFDSQWRYDVHDAQTVEDGYFVSFQAMLPW